MLEKCMGEVMWILVTLFILKWNRKQEKQSTRIRAAVQTVKCISYFDLLDDNKVIVHFKRIKVVSICCK